MKVTASRIYSPQGVLCIWPVYISYFDKTPTFDGQTDRQIHR